MRATTRQIVSYYVNQMDLRGRVLEIGGHTLSSCAVDLFPQERFEYFDLNFQKADIPNTIIGDITTADNIEDESFDVVFSSDVFEHIDRPWLAANEISRILKPGGIAITATLWAWRSHPCPIDYWRFSPECLEFLFEDLMTLEAGFDVSERRHNKVGNWSNYGDAVPLDRLGGFRENWAVYHVGLKKPANQEIPVPFKNTEHREAEFLRQDVRGDEKRVSDQRRRYAKGKLFVASLKKSRVRSLLPRGIREKLRKFVRGRV